MTIAWLNGLVTVLAVLSLLVGAWVFMAYLHERRELERVARERREWEAAVADLRKTLQPSDAWKAKHPEEAES